MTVNLNLNLPALGSKVVAGRYSLECSQTPIRDKFQLWQLNLQTFSLIFLTLPGILYIFGYFNFNEFNFSEFKIHKIQLLPKYNFTLKGTAILENCSSILHLFESWWNSRVSSWA